MERRSLFAVRLVCLLVLSLVVVLSACTPATGLQNVTISPDAISPDGDGVDDEAAINYTLQRNSSVSILLKDNAGREYALRRDEQRSTGSYTALFNGTHSPDSQGPDRRVMPDGEYEVLLSATPVDSSGNAAGQAESWKGRIVLRQADTLPPVVSDVVSRFTSISPDGDAQEDETDISYSLSKPARVTITASDESGNVYLLDPPTERSAALHSHFWNGTSSGLLLPDATYTVHIQAQDKAGNVSEATTAIAVNGGGVPKLEITRVRFSPASVPRGGDLNVEIRVRNAGKVALRTIGPEPGTPYDTDTNFNTWTEGGTPKYFERAGVWRVGVEWSTAGRPYPVRWALTQFDEKLDNPDGTKGGFPELQPGEEAVITGSIKVLINNTQEVYFWASVAQEGVGFPGGRVGQQRIRVSY